LLFVNLNAIKNSFPGFFMQAVIMSILCDKNWIFSIFAVVVLTTGTAYFYDGNLSKQQSETVELTNLSDADIDLIVEVKTAMYAASIESY
jgi:hypothetical protein